MCSLIGFKRILFRHVVLGFLSAVLAKVHRNTDLMAGQVNGLELYVPQALTPT